MRFPLALLTLAFCCSAAARADQLVVNGGFETGTFAGWQVQYANAGSDLFVGSSYQPAVGNRYAAHFDGLVYQSYDAISQQLSTSAGATYAVSFALSEQGCDVTDCDFQALWNGRIFYDSLGSQGGSDETFAYTLLGKGNDLLTFRAFNQLDRTLLDTVSASTATPPPVVTPEPSSLLLMGTGLFGAALRLRKRLH